MLVVEALLAGFAIGAIVGLLGAGGGILSVPVLIYLLHQSPHNAAAGSLVIVGLTALVSLVPQVKSGKIQWRDGLIFGILSIFGSVAGSRISLLINEILLLVLFGVLLAGVAVMMLHKAITIRRDENLLANTEKANTEEQPTKESEKSPQARNLFALIAAATCTGFLTGFFGVGGGFIVVPMLIFALGFQMREAAATSLVVMIIAAISGLLARLGTAVVFDWFVIIPFVFASMLGGMLGAVFNDRFRSSTLTALFSLLLAGVAAFVLAQNIPLLITPLA